MLKPFFIVDVLLSFLLILKDENKSFSLSYSYVIIAIVGNQKYFLTNGLLYIQLQV